MTFEGAASTESLAQKYDSLRERAEKQIAAALLSGGHETNETDAAVIAEKIFEGRMEIVSEMYQSSVNAIEHLAPQPSRIKQMSADLIDQMTAALADQGYIEEGTARRLASLIVHIEETDTDEESVES